MLTSLKQSACYARVSSEQQAKRRTVESQIAALYSLIASCKANQVEPWAYLRNVFTRLPALSAEDPELLDQLLPDRWLQAHPQHRWNIDEIRRKERKKRHQKLRQRRKK